MVTDWCSRFPNKRLFADYMLLEKQLPGSLLVVLLGQHPVGDVGLRENHGASPAAGYR